VTTTAEADKNRTGVEVASDARASVCLIDRVLDRSIVRVIDRVIGHFASS
jgi:hypothetical protein